MVDGVSVERDLPDYSQIITGLQPSLTLELLKKEQEKLEAEYQALGYEEICTHGDVNAENCIYNKDDGWFHQSIYFGYL